MDASTDSSWGASGVLERGARLTPPNNTEAEANVLAAMMLSREVVEGALVELLPDDFYRPAHKTLFLAMHEMYDKNIPIDAISLVDYLTSIEKLEAVGGEAYILELMGNTLALVNWQHHAGIVRRDAMLREIIGARPAVGKTSFALNLALNAAAEGYTVAFFSLEMSGKEIAQRFICAHAQINMSNFRTGKISPQEWVNINEATAELSQLDILIDDTPGTTVTEIRAKARRMTHNKEKSIIILDYLQLVNPPAGRRAESRAVEVSEMSRGLKIMAKELEVPLIALSQLSRQVESRTGKRPQLSDLRESGSIEQDADIVMFLDRSSSEQEAARDDRPGEGITRIVLAKNRSGPIGDVDLVFLPSSTKFFELEKDAEQ